MDDFVHDECAGDCFSVEVVGPLCSHCAGDVVDLDDHLPMYNDHPFSVSLFNVGDREDGGKDYRNNESNE